MHLKNTLVLGFITGLTSTAIGLLFAYVEVYVKLRTKVLEKLFSLVSMLRWCRRPLCCPCP